MTPALQRAGFQICLTARQVRDQQPRIRPKPATDCAAHPPVSDHYGDVLAHFTLPYRSARVLVIRAALWHGIQYMEYMQDACKTRERDQPCHT